MSDATQRGRDHQRARDYDALAESAMLAKAFVELGILLIWLEAKQAAGMFRGYLKPFVPVAPALFLTKLKEASEGSQSSRSRVKVHKKAGAAMDEGGPRIMKSSLDLQEIQWVTLAARAAGTCMGSWPSWLGSLARSV